MSGKIRAPKIVRIRFEWEEIIDSLPDREVSTLFKYIFDYYAERTLPTIDGPAKDAFIKIKDQIDSDIKEELELEELEKEYDNN